jgi:hypothetical protein
MPEASRCWVCGRSAEEIQSSLDAETPEETEIKKQITQITWFRSKFLESAAVWRRSIPKEFRDMDFTFVTNNSDQFRSIDVLGELIDAKKLMLDWLGEASNSIKKGEGALGTVSVASLNKAESEALTRALDLFEGKWHRYLSKEEKARPGAAVLPVGFEGLKLGDGLEYIVAGGLFYYDFQTQLFDIARVKAANAKPKWTIGLVSVPGNPRVALCNVCESLIKELRVPEREVARVPESAPASRPSKERATMHEQAEEVQQAAAIPQMAVEAAPTAAAPEQEIVEGSPQFVELVKKIGPANAAKENNRGRFLHEHRLKEDWEEISKEPGEGNGK